MTERIGIFGGSFDPVHNGHIEAIHSFLNCGLIDQLWVMPTPDPPHKRQSALAEYQHRVEMLKLAINNISNVTINEVESTLPSPSFTLQTLIHVKKEHPNTLFYLCLGEDSITNFDQWYHYKDILEECHLIVVRRPGFDTSSTPPEILEKAIFIDHHPIDVSSTRIRKDGMGKSTFDLPEGVAGYIQKHNLYPKKDI